MRPNRCTTDTSSVGCAKYSATATAHTADSSKPKSAKCPQHAQLTEGIFRLSRRLGAAWPTYTCFLFFADKNGQCWPKVSTIADMLGKSRSTISEFITALEKAALVRREKQWRDDGGQKQNVYTVSLDGLPLNPPVGRTDTGSRSNANSERQRSFLMPIDGGALLANSNVSLSAQPTPHVGSADTPCRQASDTKEQLIRTEKSLSPGRDDFDAFNGFRPGPEIYQLAGERGIEDIDNVVAIWKAWNIEHGKPFPENPDASLEIWIRRERRDPQKRGPPRPQQRRPGGLVANTLNQAKRAYLNG
jgi:Helix-turn-helix domain